MKLSPAERRRVWLFAIAFLAINLGSPLQLAGWLVLPSWRMYHAYRQDLCRVKTLDRGAPIDRYALLGFEEPQRAPRDLRQIRSPERARKLQRELCGALGPPSVVEIQLSCGGEPGWVEHEIKPLKCRRKR